MGISQKAQAIGMDGRQQDTRERLLDVAERLFAERGFGGVTSRALAEEAEVNNAAMNYHFGTKGGLLRAVFERRLGPINAERERLLSEALATPEPPDVARIIWAFIGPTLALGDVGGEHNFKVLAARASMDPLPEVRDVVFGFYDAIGHKFVESIKAACPHLGREELFWRLSCVYGAMLYIRADNGRLQRLLGEDLSFSDAGRAETFMLPFLSAGMGLLPIKTAVELVPAATPDDAAPPSKRRSVVVPTKSQPGCKPRRRSP